MRKKAKIYNYQEQKYDVVEVIAVYDTHYGRQALICNQGNGFFLEVSESILYYD